VLQRQAVEKFHGDESLTVSLTLQSRFHNRRAAERGLDCRYHGQHFVCSSLLHKPRIAK
jgi:hypothetical protein